MGYIDLVAVIAVCVTVIGLYLLERNYLASMRTDAAMHAGFSKDWADKAAISLDLAIGAATSAANAADRALASADRAATVAELDKKKLTARVDALEAGRRM